MATVAENVTFANALKAFRRGAHVHGKDWRCMVMYPERLQPVVFREAVSIMNGSSHANGLQIYYGTQSMVLANGATIGFVYGATADTFQLKLAGACFTHVILLDLDDEQIDVDYWLRSPTVPREDFKVHTCKGI